MAHGLTVTAHLDGYRLVFDEPGGRYEEIEAPVPQGGLLLVGNHRDAWDMALSAHMELQRWLASRAEIATRSNRKDA